MASSLNYAFSQMNSGLEFCGPIDLTIAIDNTNSMSGAINNVIAELPEIIDQLNLQSENDTRLGYITFKDDVVVQNPLTTDLQSVRQNLEATTASLGAELPEASDEAKNTAVNNLGPRDGQTGDFSEPWRENATKILILITDAPPGGFNDVTDQEDVDRMHQVALTAQSKGIRVSDVFVPTEGDYAGQVAILRDDATTSNGWYIETAPDGTGTADAIKVIAGGCGVDENPNKVSNGCLQENVQHWDKIIFNITDTDLAESVGLPANTELDIKVMDDPSVVVDLKKRVLDFLNGTSASTSYGSVNIIDVEYALICVDNNSTSLPPVIPPIACGPNEELDDGECIPIDVVSPPPVVTPEDCNQSETFIDGECIPIDVVSPPPVVTPEDCNQSETFIDGECVPIPVNPDIENPLPGPDFRANETNPLDNNTALPPDMVSKNPPSIDPTAIDNGTETDPTNEIPMTDDVNDNGIPDFEEPGAFEDDNGNGIPDGEEARTTDFIDENANGIDDRDEEGVSLPPTIRENITSPTDINQSGITQFSPIIEENITSAANVTGTVNTTNTTNGTSDTTNTISSLEELLNLG
ncbi:MAG: VWA domain-containing protein [Candidatus Nitrosocosmicus sp.]